MTPAAGAQAHAEILRMVALDALADARAAWRKSKAKPTEANLRAALRSSVLAARALRRASASVENANEEHAMLDKAALLDETSAGLKRQLARLVVSASES